MGLMLWRLTTLVLAALSMALSFCHVMEMPVRLAWDPLLWMQTTNFGGLYFLFGTLGAAIDVAAILAAFVLVRLVFNRSAGRYFALAGAALMAIGLGTWFAIVAPMNATMANWTPDILPADFEAVRQQWEWGHASIAAIKFAGFTALLLSVLSETRDGARPGTAVP